MDTPSDKSQNPKSLINEPNEDQSKVIDIQQIINYLNTLSTNKQKEENSCESLLQEILNLGVLNESNTKQNLLDFHLANRCKSFEDFFKFDGNEKTQGTPKQDKDQQNLGNNNEEFKNDSK